MCSSALLLRRKVAIKAGVAAPYSEQGAPYTMHLLPSPPLPSPLFALPPLSSSLFPLRLSALSSQQPGFI
jgi:hypothetical protein